MRESQLIKVLEGPPPACDLRVRYTGRQWVVSVTYGDHSVTGSSTANLALAFWDVKNKIEGFTNE